MTLKGQRALRGDKIVIQEEQEEKPVVILIPLARAVPILIPPSTATVSYKLVAEKAPVLVPVPMPQTVISYSPAVEGVTTPVAVSPEVLTKPIRPVVASLLTEMTFKSNQSRLTQSGKRYLDEYAKFLKQNPDLIVVIEGHTDRLGSKKYNRALGMRRAIEVWKALKQAGVKNQMGVVSYGEDRPLDPAKTKSAYAKNRRAEIQVEDNE